MRLNITWTNVMISCLNHKIRKKKKSHSQDGLFLIPYPSLQISMAVGSSTAQTANAQAALRLTSSFPECNSITKFSMPLAFRNYKANINWSRNRNRNNKNKFWNLKISVLHSYSILYICDNYRKHTSDLESASQTKAATARDDLACTLVFLRALRSQKITKNENKITCTIKLYMIFYSI